jgi:hypothetical protein
MGAGNPNWHKGMVSPNTKGRNLKGLTLADLYTKQGNQKINVKDATNPLHKFNGMTFRDAHILNSYSLAVLGDEGYSKEVNNREYGKVVDEIKILQGRIPQVNWSVYTDRELIILQKLLAKGEPSDDADTSEVE